MPGLRLASERSDHPARSGRGAVRMRKGIDHVSGVPAAANRTSEECIMLMFGIDPHEASHTTVAVDCSEVVVDTVSVDADRHQRSRLLEWAARFEPRIWAVQGATGIGATLAQQRRPSM
jgi:hypothetical protein